MAVDLKLLQNQWQARNAEHRSTVEGVQVLRKMRHLLETTCDVPSSSLITREEFPDYFFVPNEDGTGFKEPREFVSNDAIRAHEEELVEAGTIEREQQTFFASVGHEIILDTTTFPAVVMRMAGQQRIEGFRHKRSVLAFDFLLIFCTEQYEDTVKMDADFMRVLDETPYLDIHRLGPVEVTFEYTQNYIFQCHRSVSVRNGMALMEE